jgi:hypothetical protein
MDAAAAASPVASGVEAQIVTQAVSGSYNGAFDRYKGGFEHPPPFLTLEEEEMMM